MIAGKHVGSRSAAIDTARPPSPERAVVAQHAHDSHEITTELTGQFVLAGPGRPAQLAEDERDAVADERGEARTVRGSMRRLSVPNEANSTDHTFRSRSPRKRAVSSR